VLIRGWGATILLYPVRHVPCIRICAPLENRIRWLMERLDTDDPDIAREEIERSDSAHATRIRHTFNVTLGDPLLYDIVLNTGGVSIEGCIEQIVGLSRRPEFQPTPESIAHLRNLALQARIQTALREHAPESQIDIVADVEGGSVALRGVVMDESERALVQRIVREVPGVERVDNELRVMKITRRYTQAAE